MATDSSPVVSARAPGAAAAGLPAAAPEVEFPLGFAAYAGHAGLRDRGDDVAVVVAAGPCAAAGVFTQSRFAGPSVVLSRSHLASGDVRGIVVVAKNANVATGAAGAADAAAVTGLAARAAGVAPSQMLIASTGVIGRRYPMDDLRRHFGRIQPESFSASPLEVARAMMTTDTRPKLAERRVGAARVVGVAKGVGMIEPDMATMLAFVFTDAEVDARLLDGMWRRAVGATFNCLSIDTDTSTSDTAVVLASGAAGPADHPALASALREVCLDLTLQLARDGEGATKLLIVSVNGGRDHAQAQRIAKAVVNSPLVKTAVHGADPNWGRVAMAVGKNGEDTDIDPERVVIRIGGREAYPSLVDEAGLAVLRRLMQADHVDIDVDLGIGAGEATAYGCDLSAEYVRINADYTT